MAELERRVAETPATQTHVDLEMLPGLFGRLGDDVMTLLDTKLSLVKVELKEDAAVYVRASAMIAVGAVLAAVGFALVNVALAFLISTLFTFDDPRINYALGFIITGAIYLVIGGIIIALMKNRLTARTAVPNRSHRGTQKGQAMAEERNVGLARATEHEGGEDSTKEELQRRMEEARESITQTVTEIKETVATQYQNVRTTINESLDWREQFRRRPLPFTIGALGVGVVLGYSIGGVLAGGGSDDDYDEDDYDTEDAALLSSAERTYASQAITGGAYGSTAYPQASAQPAASGV